MKYNVDYQKSSTVNHKRVTLGLCPAGVDPWPGTVAGTRALVERYYALKGERAAASTPEDGGGGAPGTMGTTTPTPVRPKKTKSQFTYEVVAPEHLH